jgi:hypothetical protein
MTSESLSNDLGLSLFDYLAPLASFHAFLYLNLRIETLLFIDYRPYRIDFRLLNRNNFQALSQLHVPEIINLITSLHLSDENHARGQAFLFIFSHRFGSIDDGTLINLDNCVFSSEAERVLPIKDSTSDPFEIRLLPLL